MTRASYSGILLVTVLLVLLSGCREEPPAPQPAPRRVQPAVAEKQAVTQAEEAAREPAEPVFVYDPSGRRDPFLPLTRIRTPVTSDGEPLTPLQQFDLGQFRLIGIIIGRSEPMAMVMAPGGKSYILRRGIRIGKNDGRVIDIRGDTVVVEERYYDFAGQYRTSIQEIQLSKSEGV